MGETIKKQIQDCVIMLVGIDNIYSAHEYRMDLAIGEVEIGEIDEMEKAVKTVFRSVSRAEHKIRGAK
mgnify:CR=1 FL=1